MVFIFVKSKYLHSNKSEKFPIQTFNSRKPAYFENKNHLFFSYIDNSVKSFLYSGIELVKVILDVDYYAYLNCARLSFFSMKSIRVCFSIIKLKYSYVFTVIPTVLFIYRCLSLFHILEAIIGLDI